MPLQEIDDYGSSADGSVNTEYCAHCYQGGSFTNERTMEEMIETNLRYLHVWNEGQGTTFTEDEARDILKVHLATLKRWKTAAADG